MAAQMAAPAVAATIKYGCNCGRSFSIADLYYCQGCQRVLCKYCVTEEIESYFCPNCLENLASAEAAMFANRCKKCFQCPICFCALNLSSLANSEHVFLSCGFCRWNSLHLKMVGENPTKLVADINKAEREDPLQADINSLLEELRKQVKDQLRDKRHKEKFKRSTEETEKIATEDDETERPLIGKVNEALRDSLGSIPASSAPFSLADLEKRRASAEHQLTFQGKSEQKRTVPTTYSTPSVPEVSQADFSSITTLAQRFSALSTQPSDTKNLVPSRVALQTRRTKRCRDCDKLLIKPDLSPAKVEFKRHLVAMLYVPKLTLVPFSSSSWPLKVTQKNPAILCVTNPLKMAMQVTLSQVTVPNKSNNNVTVSLPSTPVVVGPTDYVEGAEEEYEEAKKKDTPTIVAMRRGNKLYLHVAITPTTAAPSINFTLRVQVKGTSALGPVELSFDASITLESVCT